MTCVLLSRASFPPERSQAVVAPCGKSGRQVNLRFPEVKRSASRLSSGSWCLKETKLQNKIPYLCFSVNIIQCESGSRSATRPNCIRIRGKKLYIFSRKCTNIEKLIQQKIFFLNPCFCSFSSVFSLENSSRSAFSLPFGSGSRRFPIMRLRPKNFTLHVSLT